MCDKPWEHSLRDFIDGLSFSDRVVLLIFVAVVVVILIIDVPARMILHP